MTLNITIRRQQVSLYLRMAHMTFGINIKKGTGGKQIELECTHQNGLLYIVENESNWVCPEQYIEAHTLAGFFGELIDLDNKDVKELMQKWGLYFRRRPLKES